jgi:hypothetical protein
MKSKGPILTGAEIFFECLKREKVEHIFGFPEVLYLNYMNSFMMLISPAYSGSA